MGAQAFRQHDRHLVEHPLGRLLQLRIAQALDQPGADRDGLDLVDGEHQRRQVEALAQHVAQAGRALDRHAARLQGRDVAIDRAHGDFQLFGERAAVTGFLAARRTWMTSNSRSARMSAISGRSEAPDITLSVGGG